MFIKNEQIMNSQLMPGGQRTVLKKSEKGLALQADFAYNKRKLTSGRI